MLLGGIGSKKQFVHCVMQLSAGALTHISYGHALVSGSLQNAFMLRPSRQG